MMLQFSEIGCQIAQCFRRFLAVRSIQFFRDPEGKLIQRDALFILTHIIKLGRHSFESRQSIGVFFSIQFPINRICPLPQGQCLAMLLQFSVIDRQIAQCFRRFLAALSIQLFRDPEGKLIQRDALFILTHFIKLVRQAFQTR